MTLHPIPISFSLLLFLPTHLFPSVAVTLSLSCAEQRQQEERGRARRDRAGRTHPRSDGTAPGPTNCKERRGRIVRSPLVGPMNVGRARGRRRPLRGDRPPLARPSRAVSRDLSRVDCVVSAKREDVETWKRVVEREARYVGE